MSDTYIIEVSSQPAGIVVRDSGGYRFFAATHRFNALEGRLFRNAREAERERSSSPAAISGWWRKAPSLSPDREPPLAANERRRKR